MKNSSRERKLALIIAVILAVAGTSAFFARSSVPGPEMRDVRLPAGKPLLEPDRPDLRGEPGISKDDAQGDNPDE